MEFKTEIDFENPPDIIEIKYGNPINFTDGNPITITDYLCPEHMKSFVAKDQNNTFRFRYQPVISMKKAKEGKICRICSYTRGIPKS